MFDYSYALMIGLLQQKARLPEQGREAGTDRKQRKLLPQGYMTRGEGDFHMDGFIRKTDLFNRIAPFAIGVDNAAGVIATSIEAGGSKFLEIPFDSACFIRRP